MYISGAFLALKAAEQQDAQKAGAGGGSSCRKGKRLPG